MNALYLIALVALLFFLRQPLVVVLLAVCAFVQIVWGREDGIVPLIYADDWAAALPGATLHVVSGAAHLPQVERPEEFLALTGLRERSEAGGPRWN